MTEAQSVALRKESVDRNQIFPPTWMLTTQSLSARRAWIEITQRRDFRALGLVALRKESVDRNALLAAGVMLAARRSPQGERG